MVSSLQGLYESALAAFDRGEWQQAHALGERLIEGGRDDAELRFVVGASALQLGNVPAAIPHLRRGTELAPQRADLASQLARALVMAGLWREAVAVADAGMALQRLDPSSCTTFGVVYVQANLHDRATDAFSRAVTMAPDNPGYRFNLATSLMFDGQFDAAERECAQCIALNPHSWRAFLLRSQLRRQKPDSNHIDELGRVLARSAGNPEAELHLRLALSKEFEDVGRYDEAFDQLARGKAVHRRHVAYDSARDAKDIRALMRGFEGCVGQGAGCPSQEPIFVLGMPRSGTTLIDRVLSAHPQVQSAGELDNFEVALRREVGLGAGSHEALADVLMDARLDWSRLGQRYLDSTRPTTGASPRFVDKMPHNFLFLGFIARALPNATIVLVKRDPMDACLSNFRQLFAPGMSRFDYSYDLLDVGRYYLLFEEMIDFWRARLPGRIHEVQYEDLVREQVPFTRGLLAACGLEWDDACLSPEKSRASISTASAVQLRAPINDASIGRWRRYGARMDALRRLLVDGGIAVPADTAP